MYRRYVVNKTNRLINCYQGILVTLGTMLHNEELTPSLQREVEAMFGDLDKLLLTPPNMTNETFKHSVSWYKKNSPNFVTCSREMSRASQILFLLGHEVLILETKELNNVLYEDMDQILAHAGSYYFTVVSEVSPATRVSTQSRHR